MPRTSYYYSVLVDDKVESLGGYMFATGDNIISTMPLSGTVAVHQTAGELSDLKSIQGPIPPIAFEKDPESGD
jgi:hypothetical protein